MDVRTLERALDQVALAREEKILPWLLAGAGLLPRRDAEEAVRAADADLERALADVVRWRRAAEREVVSEARGWGNH